MKAAKSKVRSATERPPSALDVQIIRAALNPDKFFADRLVHHEQEYKGGKRSALAMTIKLCAAGGVPLPPWAAKAFCDGVTEILEARVRSWDDVFGHTPLSEPKRRLAQKRLEREWVVRNWAQLHTTMAIDETFFEQMARETGLTQSVARKIYNFMPAAQKLPAVKDRPKPSKRSRR